MAGVSIMNGIKCYECGRFIAFKDFDDDRVKWVESFNLGDWYAPPEQEPICPKCLEKVDCNVEKNPSVGNEPKTNEGLSG